MTAECTCIQYSCTVNVTDVGGISVDYRMDNHERFRQEQRPLITRERSSQGAAVVDYEMRGFLVRIVSVNLPVREADTPWGD